MGALHLLSRQLAEHSNTVLRVPFAAGEAMKQVARDIARRFNDIDSGRPPADRRAQAALAFLRTNSLRTVNDLKYVCFGAADAVGPQGQSVLADTAAVAALMRTVESTKANPRLLRRCYQGLLASYLHYDGFRATGGPSKVNWVRLREFLATNLDTVARVAPLPAWVRHLREHRNVLSDTPCERYASQLLAGTAADFDELRQGLGIGDTSWVTTQTVLAAVRQTCNRRDGPFAQDVNGLIGLLKKHETVQREGLAFVLQRYSRMASPILHEGLRDFAVKTWGSPLLRGNLRNWDAAGQEATKMVELWLKSRLIEDFFELLSADGRTDRSRVEFWQGYVRSITDMYFALGNTARQSSNPDFVELRRTMGTSLLRLEGGSPSNNAFLMVMNGCVVMEFGEKGNAAFIFDQKTLPFALHGAIHSGGRSRWAHLDRMLHLSPRPDGWTWQLDFEERLRKVVGVAPDEGPIAARRQARLDAMRQECAKYGVTLEHRPQQRQFVVRTRNANVALNRALGRLGFQYNPHGYWFVED